jgi:hypothetical protein
MLKKLLESFVYEEPEVDTAPFGKYAFDLKRTDIDDDEKQQNTPTEDTVAAAIYSYISNGSKKRLGAEAELLLGLVKQGLYKPVLDPSGTDFVYRVLSADRGRASRMLGVEITDKTPYGVVGPGSLNPVGNTEISGWSSDKQLVLEFGPSLVGVPRKDVLLFYKAPVQGNLFIGKPGVLASILYPNHADEMETIAVGPVKYLKASYCIAATTNGELMQPAKKILELIDA